jgi:hypothetical protein
VGIESSNLLQARKLIILHSGESCKNDTNAELRYTELFAKHTDNRRARSSRTPQETESNACDPQPSCARRNYPRLR